MATKNRKRIAVSTAVMALLIIGVLVAQVSLGQAASGIGQPNAHRTSSTSSTTSSTSSTTSSSTSSSTTSSSTTTTTSSTSSTSSGVGITQFAPILVGPMQPIQAAYDPSNKLLYVADASSPYFSNLEGVTAINGSNWAKTFPFCPGTSNRPEYSAYDPANNYLYVSCIYPGNVAVVNPVTQSVVTTITVGSSPWVIVYDPANQDVYVSNYASNTVSVISSSTNAVIATISTGDQPLWMTYSPANNDVYVIDDTTPYGITVISGATNTVLTTFQVEASSLIYDPANQDVYAAVTAFVSGVQTPFAYAIGPSNQVVAEIALSGSGFPAGENGGSFVYDSSNQNVFVGTSPDTTAPNVVSEISSSSNTVIGTVNLPADCSQSGCYDLSYLTYDPANQDVYVSGPGVYVYVVSSGASLVQTIPLTIIKSSSTSNFPIASIFDPANNEVYVLCDNYAEMIIPLSS